MTNSEAWRCLSPKAVWVYIEILKKYRGGDPNNLSLTYKEVGHRLSSATFSKALKELIKIGFIKVVRPGGLYRRCTIYGLSDGWKAPNKDTRPG